LIASGDHLDALKQRNEYGDAMTFADTDALRALDAITRHRPAVVALERMFAATSRGAALINRIKADPSLGACEIRVVSTETDFARAATRAAVQAVGAPAAVAEPVAPVVAAPLDQRGTRRAPRFRIQDGVEVLVDGNPAALVDLSLVGAQVVSPTSLKPNQRVRLSLPDTARPIRFSAGVAWAAFEMPKGGPRYRAGIEFFDADAQAVTKFIETNKTG
jgi:CheY-like chemotaxis protein